jgi:hypothetical protein
MMIRLRIFRWKLKLFLSGLQLVFCGRCSRALLRRQSYPAQMTTGSWVRVCPACMADLYRGRHGRTR